MTDDFEGIYKYRMHYETPQYDSVKNYIRRLNRFSKSKKELPEYKPRPSARGVMTRSKAIKKSRGRPRKHHPKAIRGKNRTDDEMTDYNIRSVTRGSKSKQPLDSLMGTTIINTSVPDPHI